MGLRAKTILILSATIVFASLSAVTASLLYSSGSIQSIERSEAEAGLRRALALVQDDIDQLDVIVRDWAFWDDTWEYVQNRSPEYENSNLGQDESVLLLDLSALLILDEKGGLVFGAAVDSTWLPDLEKPFAGRIPPFIEGRRGIVRAGDSIHLVASRPVLRSDKSGQGRGTFVMTRLVDADRIERYAKLSGLPVELYAAGPTDGGTAIELVEREIRASTGLADMEGRTSAGIAVRMSRVAERYGRSSAVGFMAAILILVVGAGVVAVFLFEAAVLGRMRKLRAELEGIATNRTTGTKLAETGEDELTALQRAMNSTLDSLYHMIGERDAALREIHHRVKNNLQVVASLLSLQADSAGDGVAADALFESRRRVLAMSFVLEELYAEKALRQVDAGRLFSRLAMSSGQSFDRAGRIRSSIEAGDLKFGVDIAFPVGLIASEVISNAYRHAFAGKTLGLVAVIVQPEGGGGFRLSVRDDGIGMPSEIPKGLGLELVRILAEQLKAEYRFEAAPGGGSLFVLDVPPIEAGEG